MTLVSRSKRLDEELRSCFRVLPSYAQNTSKVSDVFLHTSTIVIPEDGASQSTRLKSCARGLKPHSVARWPIVLVRVVSRSVEGNPASLAPPDAWCRGPLGPPYSRPLACRGSLLLNRGLYQQKPAHGGGGFYRRLVEKRRHPCTRSCPRTPAQSVYDQESPARACNPNKRWHVFTSP